MEENKQNKNRQEKPGQSESRPAKRSVSCNGKHLVLSSETAPDSWDNSTLASAARGDECLDAETQHSSEVGPDTRKRKCSVQTTPVLGKRFRYERPSQAPLTSTESSDHADLSQGDGTASLRRFPAQAFLVMSATAGSGRSGTTDAASQTAKSPLVPVSPVVSFYEPVPQEPTSLEVSYFGAGARLKDGTLRPPPVICTPGASPSKDVSSKTEEPKPVVKDWTLKKEPTSEVKRFRSDEDQKKKKDGRNTDRYLNMF